MSGYWALVSAHLRTELQYRAAAIAGMVTQLVFGLIIVGIYRAFYSSAVSPQPMALRDVITYVWLGQALLRMLPWNVDRELRLLIRSGGVAYEMLRPLDLYSAWYCRALAWRAAPTLLRALPMVAIAMPLLGMQPPASLTAGLACAAAIGGALLLGCAITTLMNISLLWTVSGDGISQLVPVLVVVLSGMALPLPLFPAWAQPLLRVLPFAGLVDTPFRLYVGHLPVSQLPSLLAHQLAWSAALILLGRWVLARGLRRLVVQGG